MDPLREAKNDSVQQECCITPLRQVPAQHTRTKSLDPDGLVWFLNVFSLIITASLNFLFHLMCVFKGRGETSHSAPSCNYKEAFSKFLDWLQSQSQATPRISVKFMIKVSQKSQTGKLSRSHDLWKKQVQSASWLSQRVTHRNPSFIYS